MMLADWWHAHVLEFVIFAVIVAVVALAAITERLLGLRQRRRVEALVTRESARRGGEGT